jgi:hypothetical protein
VWREGEAAPLVTLPDWKIEGVCIARFDVEIEAVQKEREEIEDFESLSLFESSKCCLSEDVSDLTS